MALCKKAYSSRWYRITSLLVVAYVFFFFRLGVMPLLDPDEARYTAASRTMVRSGDWIVPRWNNEIRLQKPILFYWLQAIALKTIPDEEYAARLPSALAATATVLMVYWFGCRRWGEGYGITAALGFAVFPLTLVLGRAAITDMTLTACVTASILFLLVAYREGRPGFLVAAYAACGAALLTKGFVALLFVSSAVAPVLWSSEMRKSLNLRHHLLGLITMLAVLTPWLVLITKRIPGVWSYWILNETIARVFTNVKHRHIAWWFYMPATFASTFPVSLAFLRISSWKGGLEDWRERRLSLENRALFLWIVMPLLFFSLSRSQLWTYAMPVLPAVALLCGPAWYGIGGKRGGDSKTAPKRLVLTVCTFIIILFTFLISPISGYIGRRKSARDLVAAAGLDRLPEDFVVLSYKYNRYPALLYYAQRNIPKCDLEEVLQRLESDAPVVVVSTWKALDGLFNEKGLFCLGTSWRACVVCNRRAKERIDEIKLNTTGMRG